MAESELGDVNFSRVLRERWRQFQDRRIATRFSGGRAVVYYWDGSVPHPHPIRDISQAGVFVYTSERWYIGTMLHLTIDLVTESTVDGSRSEVTESMKVWSKVVWHAEDGVGFQFIIGKAEDRKKMADLVDAVSKLCERSNGQ